MINGYTVIFQIINFLILVFLLRRFLYGPIMRSMKEREQRIVQREVEAAEQERMARREEQAYRRKLEELQQRGKEIQDEARSAAEVEKGELLEEARREVEERKRRWEEAFEREKESFILELRRRIGRQACSIARRCLQDLADARLQELTWDLFIRKTDGLPESERRALREALFADNQGLVLRSAFEIPPGGLQRLQATLQDIFDDSENKSGQALEAALKIDPALICGLELQVGGYRLAWSIDSYLEEVEEGLLVELERTNLAERPEEVPGGGKREGG